MVKIGHSSIDENGKATGGNAGDQTKKEVCTRGWYDGNWNYVLRPKTLELAEKSAKFMEGICDNDNVGYDQSGRNTLYKTASKVNFDVTKIKVRCECDCSSAIHVSVIAGGANIKYGSNGFTTRTMVKILKDSGYYEVLPATSKYLKSDKYLKRGDILVREGSHTIMVLENGSEVDKKPVEVEIDPAQSVNKKLKGTYKTTSDLHLRSGASAKKTSIVVIPKGTEVECCGHYTEAGGTKWMFTDVTINGVNYIGFSSSRYLKLT